MLTKFFTQFRLEIFVFLLLVFLGIFYLWPIRFLPYHLESANLIINGTKLLQSKQFQSLTLSEFNLSHPPLFMLWLHTVWQAAGETSTTSHFSILPFFVILLFSQYWLAKKYVPGEIAVVATFVLSFIPIVVAELQLISIDLAVAALTTLTLTLWLYNFRIASMISLSLGILTYWTALLLLPALVYDWFRHQKRSRWQLFLIPIGTAVIWTFYHGTTSGWWLVSPEVGLSTPPSLWHFIQYLLYVARSIAFSQANSFVILSALLFIPWLSRTKRYTDSEFQLVILASLVIICGLAYFGFVGNFMLSDSLFLYPLFLTLATINLAHFSRTTTQASWMCIGILTLIGLIYLSRWSVNNNQGPGYHFRPDTNLAYQDNILVSRQAAKYLELNHSESLIYGGFPEAYQLREPHQGYVEDSLSFDSCQNFTYNESYKQVIYTHPYHPSQIACQQLLKEYVVLPEQTFTANGKWIEIYTINATRSAQPNESEL